MTILALLPGTAEWLLTRLDLRVQLSLRKEMRRLVRASDASYAGLFVLRGAGPPDELEWAGEHVFGVRVFPELRSALPSFDEVVSRDGERRHAVVHTARLGRRMPVVGVIVVDPGDVDGAVLLDGVSASAERVEEIVVAALPV